MMIHPVVVGHGKRLVQDSVDTRSFQLSDTRTFPGRVVMLTCQRAAAEGEPGQTVSRVVPLIRDPAAIRSPPGPSGSPDCTAVPRVTS